MQEEPVDEQRKVALAKSDLTDTQSSPPLRNPPFKEFPVICLTRLIDATPCEGMGQREAVMIDIEQSRLVPWGPMAEPIKGRRALAAGFAHPFRFNASSV